jgi:hypothetical protein
MAAAGAAGVAVVAVAGVAGAELEVVQWGSVNKSQMECEIVREMRKWW